MEHLGRVIRDRRKADKLTLEAFSAKLQENQINMSPSAISRYESGVTKKIPQDNLIKILTILGIDIKETIDSNSKEDFLEIGIAFAIWSSPLILVLHDYCRDELSFGNGSLKNFKLRFTSYGIYKGTGNLVKPNHLPFRFGKNTKEDFFGFKSSQFIHESNQEKIYTYTAKHLRQFLNQGDLDLIAIAGNLAESVNYRVVANFMNVANEGCELAFFINKNLVESEENADLSRMIQNVSEGIIGKIDEFSEKIESGALLNIFWLMNLRKVAQEYLDDKSYSGLKSCEKNLMAIIKYTNDEITEIAMAKSVGENIIEIKNTNSELYRNLLKRCFRIPLIYAEGTIASEHYDVYLKNQFENQIVPSHICFAAEDDWFFQMRNIICPFIDEEKNHDKSIVFPMMFFGWEPKISHFKKKAGKVYKKVKADLDLGVLKKNFNLSESFSSQEKKYFTFDLVTKRKSTIDLDLVYQFVLLLKIYVNRFNESIAALKDFERKKEEKEAWLEELKKKRSDSSIELIDEIFEKEAKDFEDKVFHNKEVKIISSFLDLEPMECYDSLKKLQFTHWVNSDWMDNYLTQKMGYNESNL